MKQIITVGREFGSGGREFARHLSEILQFAYYDQEIITEIANKTELSEKYVQNILDNRPAVSFPIHTGRSFYVPVNPLFEHSQIVYQKQCEIIQEMAQKSNCVIVGRCADYILREYKPFRIFVYADMQSKIKRCREREQEPSILTDKEFQKKILEVDKHRSQYYGFYTDQIWGDRINYDLCINTTNAAINEVTEVIAKLFKK